VIVGVPAVVTRPIEPVAGSVNHMFESGPITIAPGWGMTWLPLGGLTSN